MDKSSSLTKKKGADVDASTHSGLHQLPRGSVASVSASFKATTVRKDPYKSNLYFTGASVIANVHISPGLD